jgi:hypothetical protein
VLENLAFATYEVRVVQPGYTTARQSVAVTSGKPDQDISVRLQQAAPGAAVSAGRGASPARGSAAPAGRAASQTGKPEVFTGTVYVDSRPRGARVYIDGKPVGETPLSVPDVRIGTHVVRLELPDHRIWSSTATVTAGQQVRVTGSLERIQ